MTQGIELLVNAQYQKRIFEQSYSEMFEVKRHKETRTGNEIIEDIKNKLMGGE